jgi:hypothetical protein
MKRTPLAIAVAALVTASAFAFAVPIRDDCREFHVLHHRVMPHHRVQFSLRKKSQKNTSASSKVGKRLRTKSISKLKLRHSGSTMKKLPASRIARCLKRKRVHEAEANRQGQEHWKKRESAKQEAIRRSPERTNELPRQAAEAEEMNRKTAEARVQAAEAARVQAAETARVQSAEARVQEDRQKRRLEKAYLDSLSPGERRARNICRPVYAQYNRVETGMDLDRVQEIFDCNGKELSKIQESGSVTTFRSFGDLARGGMAIIFFSNGKVTSKSQIGLQGETGET